MKERFNSFYENRFLIMLIALFGLILFEPLISYFIKIHILVRIFLTLIFLSGIFAVSYKKHQPIIASLLAFPTIILMWVSHFIDIGGLESVKNFFSMLFMLFMIILFLNHFFREIEINREVIFGALVVYLLIGLMWAFGYSLLEDFQPGSFSHSGTLDNNALIYFSYVTLTTLGYGDITPVSSLAKAMSLTEAVTGQIYLTVLVAQLVGINIAQQMEKNRN